MVENSDAERGREGHAVRAEDLVWPRVSGVRAFPVEGAAALALWLTVAIWPVYEFS